MTSIRYPPPLHRGDTVAVTAPSAGVDVDLEERLQYSLHAVRNMGYTVREGACLRGNHMTSASAQQRATELISMLLDDTIQAIIPPWGGELLIDILPLIDFAQLAQVNPKWIIGYSDITTFMLPYTLLTHIATVHGSNLLETPNLATPGGPMHWHDVLTHNPETPFTQHPAVSYQATSFDWRRVPHVESFNCTEPVAWKCLHHETDRGYSVTVTGRLIGGCLDVITMLLGSPFGDVPHFAQECAPEGLLLYVETADGNTAQFCRMLHSLRLAGWTRYANAILIGRSGGMQLREFTVHDAIKDALGQLNIPVIYDMDIGHLPPQLILVNGAMASVDYSPALHTITQTLV